MSATERKYALTRLNAGDYLLPSNDGTTLLRVSSYVEDGSGGNYIAGKWTPVVGTFWNCYRFIGTMTEAERILIDDPDTLLDWDEWREIECGLRTRKEAIQSGLAAC